MSNHVETFGNILGFCLTTLGSLSTMGKSSAVNAVKRGNASNLNLRTHPTAFSERAEVIDTSLTLNSLP